MQINCGKYGAEWFFSPQLHFSRLIYRGPYQVINSIPCRGLLEGQLQNSGIIKEDQDMKWVFNCSSENVTVGDYNVTVNFSKNMYVPLAYIPYGIFKLVAEGNSTIITNILDWDFNLPNYVIQWTVSKLDCDNTNLQIQQQSWPNPTCSISNSKSLFLY
eukprot:403373276